MQEPVTFCEDMSHVQSLDLNRNFLKGNNNLDGIVNDCVHLFDPYLLLYCNTLALAYPSSFQFDTQAKEKLTQYHWIIDSQMITCIAWSIVMNLLTEYIRYLFALI